MYIRLHIHEIDTFCERSWTLLDAAEYKCPNCSADLKFDPVTQKLSCEYCLSSFTIEEIKQESEAFKQKLEEEKLATLLNGEYDGSNAILTFHAGAGGTDRRIAAWHDGKHPQFRPF